MACKVTEFVNLSKGPIAIPCKSTAGSCSRVPAAECIVSSPKLLQSGFWPSMAEPIAFPKAMSFLIMSGRGLFVKTLVIGLSCARDSSSPLTNSAARLALCIRASSASPLTPIKRKFPLNGVQGLFRQIGMRIMHS